MQCQFCAGLYTATPTLRVDTLNCALPLFRDAPTRDAIAIPSYTLLCFCFLQPTMMLRWPTSSFTPRKMRYRRGWLAGQRLLSRNSSWNHNRPAFFCQRRSPFFVTSLPFIGYCALPSPNVTLTCHYCTSQNRARQYQCFIVRHIAFTWH